MTDILKAKIVTIRSGNELVTMALGEDTGAGKIELLACDPWGRYVDVLVNDGKDKTIHRYFNVEHFVGDYTEPANPEMQVSKGGEA